MAPKKANSCEWRAALSALTTALDSIKSNELSQAKSELETLLADVTRRVREECKTDPLVEAMCTAAQRANPGKYDTVMIHSLVGSMSTKLRVKVDNADPANCRVSASCKGDWTIHGQTYKFDAAAIEIDGKIAKRRIDVAGLNYSAGPKSEAACSKFKCDVEAADWAVRAGVKDMPVADVTRAVVAALEVLATKKARGIADFDVLKATFVVMKDAAGIAAAAPRKRLLGKKGAPIELTPEQIKQDVTVASVISDALAESKCADDVVADELKGRRKKKLEAGKNSDEELSEDVEDDDDDDEASNSEEDAGDEFEDMDAEAKEEDDDNKDTKSEKDEPNCKESKDDNTDIESKKDSVASEEETQSKSLPVKDDGDDDEEEGDAKEDKVEDEITNIGYLTADGQDHSEDDDCGNTVFVGKKALDSMKSKLKKGGTPTAAEINKLLDEDSLDDDEDMVPLDLSKVGKAFSECDNHKSAATALIKEHGAKKLAELLVAAEEEVEDGDEDEDGEEEEGEESEEEKVEDEVEEPTAPAKKKSRVK